MFAENLEQCARLCDSHNAALADPSFSFQHCNAFVYDTQTKQCALKNKRMGNFQPQQGPGMCGIYDPSAGCTPRYLAGYKVRDLYNEINDPSSPIYAASNPLFSNTRLTNEFAEAPAWSTDNYAKAGLNVANCHTAPRRVPGGSVKQIEAAAATAGWGNYGGIWRPCEESRLAHHKPIQYDVRRGAIFSTMNTGVGGSQPVWVENMNACAQMCSVNAAPFGPYSGSNAWTFWPDYQNGRVGPGGMCVIGHVREPYYQDLTPHDRGAISGFALTSLSTENQRFLFG